MNKEKLYIKLDRKIQRFVWGGSNMRHGVTDFSGTIHNTTHRDALIFEVRGLTVTS